MESCLAEDHGFNIETLGIKRIQSAGKRWRATYRESGVCGLRDTRQGNSGRPRDKELSMEEKYARLEVEINLLKAENELLKRYISRQGG